MVMEYMMCLGCFILLGKHTHFYDCNINSIVRDVLFSELDLADFLYVGTQHMLISEMSYKDITAKNHYFLLFACFNMVSLKHNQGLLPPLAKRHASYVQDNPCNNTQIKTLLIRYASQEPNGLLLACCDCWKPWYRQWEEPELYRSVNTEVSPRAAQCNVIFHLKKVNETPLLKGHPYGEGIFLKGCGRMFKGGS